MTDLSALYHRPQEPIEPKARGNTLLVDGNNLLIRSLRAAQGSGLELTNDAGLPVAPMLLFVNGLARYIRQVNPRFMAVCWDGGKSTYRNEIYDGYKSERSSVEGDEIKGSCFDLAKRFLDLAGISSMEVAGYEADDLIAHLWRHPWIAPMVILSNDKDLLQLVTPEVTQIRPDPRADDEVWTVERVEEKFGCRPEHWGFVLALAGDTSDGVPGVPRVGVKTACKDLAKVGWSIDKLITFGPDRYREHADVVRRNVRLVELRHNAAPGLRLQDPGPFDPPKPGHPLWGEFRAFLADLEFNAVLRRLDEGSFWP